MKDEKESHSHPSFGMIGFTRVSCSGKNKFFGSDLPQDNYIEMKVYNAEVARDLSSDRYHVTDHNPLIQVKMTQLQFSEMITTMNHGDGVPCTIETVCGKDVEKIADHIENRKEYTHRQFKQRMKEVAEKLAANQLEINRLTKKATLTPDDKRQIQILNEYMSQEMVKNIPYFLERFQEGMDKVVNEARLEVEAAILHKIHALGLNALQEEQNNFLTEGKKVDNAE